MAAFDSHKKCAWCHDKGLGDDLICVFMAESEYCNSLTSEQKLLLSTPSYKTHKEKKSSSPSVLVDPTSVKAIEEADASASVQKWQLIRKTGPLLRCPVRRNPRHLLCMMTSRRWTPN